MSDNAAGATLQPNVKAAQAKPLPSIGGQSPADVFAAGGGDDSDAPTPAITDFSRALSEAQGRAKGAPAPEPVEAAEPAPKAAADPAAKPKVPGLPAPAAAKATSERPTKAADWDALKAKHAEELAAARTEAARYQAELAAAKAVGDTEEIKRLRDEHKQYKETLRDVAIERDPEFKARYTAQESTARDAAVQAAGDKGDKLAKLLGLPNSPWRDEQISKLTEDLSAGSKRRVEAALTTLEQIDIARQSEIAQRRATFDEKQSTLMRTQQAREQAQRAQMDGVFGQVQKTWQEGNPFYQKVEGDTVHNAAVDETLALAKEIYNGSMTPEDLAAAAFWAASGRRMLDGWMKERSAREHAEKALERVRGVQPGEGRAGRAKSDEDAPPTAPPGSPEYLSHFNRQFKEAQARDAQAVGGRK